MPSAGTYFRFAWDIVLTSSNNKLRVTRGGVTSTVTLATGIYRWLYHSADSRDLLGYVVTQLAVQAGGTWAASIGSDGKLYLDCDQAWSILVDALTTIDRRVWGLNAVTPAAFGSAAPPYTATSPFQLGHIWQPGVRFLDHTGLRDRNVLARSRDYAGGSDTWLFATEQDLSIYVPALESRYIWAADATYESTFDLFRQACCSGGDVEWTPNIDVPGTHDAYIIDERWLQDWPVRGMRAYPQHHELDIPLQLAA